MSKKTNVMSIKLWSSRLSGIDGAKELRRLASHRLYKDSTLELNMAGVKDLTPGFAYECFGKLYNVAKERGSAIKFSHVDKDLRPILLSGVKAAAR